MSSGLVDREGDCPGDRGGVDAEIGHVLSGLFAHGWIVDRVVDELGAHVAGGDGCGAQNSVGALLAQACAGTIFRPEVETTVTGWPLP